MNPCIITKLPKLESMKGTICNYKSISVENCSNPTCAAEIVIPEKYTKYLKGRPFYCMIQGLGMGKGSLYIWHT